MQYTRAQFQDLQNTLSQSFFKYLLKQAYKRTAITVELILAHIGENHQPVLRSMSNKLRYAGKGTDLSFCKLLFLGLLVISQLERTVKVEFLFAVVRLREQYFYYKKFTDCLLAMAKLKVVKESFQSKYEVQRLKRLCESLFDKFVWLNRLPFKERAISIFQSQLIQQQEIKFFAQHLPLDLDYHDHSRLAQITDALAYYRQSLFSALPQQSKRAHIEKIEPDPQSDSENQKSSLPEHVYDFQMRMGIPISRKFIVAEKAKKQEARDNKFSQVRKRCLDRIRERQCMHQRVKRRMLFQLQRSRSVSEAKPIPALPFDPRPLDYTVALKNMWRETPSVTYDCDFRKLEGRNCKSKQQLNAERLMVRKKQPSRQKDNPAQPWICARLKIQERVRQFRRHSAF